MQNTHKFQHFMTKSTKENRQNRRQRQFCMEWHRFDLYDKNKSDLIEVINRS